MNCNHLPLQQSGFRFQSSAHQFISFGLILCTLLGTVYFALPPAVAHASCMAPTGEILGDWINTQGVIGAPGAVIAQIDLDSGCSYTTDCPEGSPCVVTVRSGFWAKLYYACNQHEECTWKHDLEIDPTGRAVWLSGEMGTGIFSMSAYLVEGRYGFTQLTVEWGMDFPADSADADFSQTEYFIRSEEMEAYFAAHTSTIDAQPPPTPTAWPTPTSTPQPTRVVPPFQTLQPANGACLTQGAQFEWQDNLGLPPGQLYEIVLWRAGEEPLKSSRGITKADTRTSRWIDLDYLDDQRDWFAPGDYNWGILAISADPYQRHTVLGVGGWFRYVRGAHCTP